MSQKSDWKRRVAEVPTINCVRNFKQEQGVEPVEGFNGCYRQIARSAKSTTGYVAVYINDKRQSIEFECDFYGRTSRSDESAVFGWLYNNEIRSSK